MLIRGHPSKTSGRIGGRGVHGTSMWWPPQTRGGGESGINWTSTNSKHSALHPPPPVRSPPDCIACKRPKLKISAFRTFTWDTIRMCGEGCLQNGRSWRLRGGVQEVSLGRMPLINDPYNSSANYSANFARVRQAGASKMSLKNLQHTFAVYFISQSRK